MALSNKYKKKLPRILIADEHTLGAEAFKTLLNTGPLRQLKARGNEEHTLTDRQRQVLQFLAEGKRMKEIGNVLRIKARTVAFHKYRIMRALNAESNARLVQYAIKHHLIDASNHL